MRRDELGVLALGAQEEAFGARGRCGARRDEVVEGAVRVAEDGEGG